MSRAEKIRGKVFGGGDKAAADDASVSRSPDAPLTISIPKPPQAQPAPPQKSRQSDSSPGPTADAQQRDDKCFRERLIHRLGEEYNGAERYRLAQDARKDLHWKRWGPYLSDRQWVRPCLTFLSLPALQFVTHLHFAPRRRAHAYFGDLLSKNSA